MLILFIMLFDVFKISSKTDIKKRNVLRVETKVKNYNN